MRIFRLGSPWALLFLILPLLCVVILILSRFIYKKGVRISGVRLFELGLTPKMLGYYAGLALIISGLFLIAFSLTRPQYGIHREKIISNGIDIMIALDVSGSMLNTDQGRQPRIDDAKRFIVDFIRKRKGDRIGLVTFSTTSLLRCPATMNYDLMVNIVKGVYVNHDKSTSTSIGLGLASAINRLEQLKDSTNPESRVVILVTDGVNNSGEIAPETAAEIAVKLGVKVYTIGIGREEEVDLDLLKSIADKTQGKFFHSRRSSNLNLIFDEINRLEKRKLETMQFTRFKNIGYRYASLGILLLFAGILLNTIFFRRLK